MMWRRVGRKKEQGRSKVSTIIATTWVGRSGTEGRVGHEVNLLPTRLTERYSAEQPNQQSTPLSIFVNRASRIQIMVCSRRGNAAAALWSVALTYFLGPGPPMWPRLQRWESPSSTTSKNGPRSLGVWGTVSGSPRAFRPEGARFRFFHKLQPPPPERIGGIEFRNPINKDGT